MGRKVCPSSYTYTWHGLLGPKALREMRVSRQLHMYLCPKLKWSLKALLTPALPQNRWTCSLAVAPCLDVSYVEFVVGPVFKESDSRRVTTIGIVHGMSLRDTMKSWLGEPLDEHMKHTAEKRSPPPAWCSFFVLFMIFSQNLLTLKEGNRHSVCQTENLVFVSWSNHWMFLFSLRLPYRSLL